MENFIFCVVMDGDVSICNNACSTMNNNPPWVKTAGFVEGPNTIYFWSIEDLVFNFEMNPNTYSKIYIVEHIMVEYIYSRIHIVK